MIFLDSQLQKIATLKMYQINGLWYARVGNSKALIDTTEKLYIRAAAYDCVVTLRITPSMSTYTSNHKVIDIVLQDNIQPPPIGRTSQFQHTTPQIHSSIAWSSAPPLLERSNTCSESDIEVMNDSIQQSTKNTQETTIPIFITTKQPQV